LKRQDLNVLFIVPPGLASERDTRSFGPFKARAFLSNAGLVLTTLLRKAGYTARLVDLDYFQAVQGSKFRLADHVRNLMSDFAPRIACISFLTHQYTIAREILRVVKEVNIRCLTIAGGVHVTFDYWSLLRDWEFLDVAVCHAGEMPLLSICESLIRGENPSGAGIATRRGCAINYSPAQPPPPDIHEYVGPIEFSMLPDTRLRESCITMLSQYGCNSHCAFCSEPNMWPWQPSMKPTTILLEDLRTLAIAGVDRVGIEDSTFSINFRFFEDPSIRDSIQFYALARASMVDDEYARAVRSSPIGAIIIGGESASDEILKKVGKGIMAHQVRTACEVLAAHGIAAGVFWILGLPGETEDTATQTLIFAEKLKQEGLVAYQDIALFMPYPGTDIARRPKHYGVEILHRMWDFYTPSGFARNPAYQLKTLDHQGLTQLYQHAQSFSVEYVPNV